MENDGIFYDYLEYITAIWDTLWPFGNFVVIWYIFPRFGIFSQEKSGNPGRKGGTLEGRMERAGSIVAREQSDENLKVVSSRVARFFFIQFTKTRKI
jgi:hypothetical protein